MDYVNRTIHFQIQSNQIFNEIIFEQMERESEMILESLDAMNYVLEATDPKGQKQNFFKKIIEFLRRIFGVFLNKAKALVQNDKGWLDENFKRFDRIDYGGLEIEMIPFWNMNESKVASELQRVQNNVSRMLTNASATGKFSNIDALKQEVFGTYLDVNGDLANGAKNFFRTGNAKNTAVAVKLTDRQLRTQALNEFRIFSRNYDKKTTATIKTAIDSAASSLERINNSVQRQTTTEAFCLIENAFYGETELSYHTHPLLEADQPAANTTSNPPSNNNNANANKEDNKVSTSVKVTDHGSKAGAQEQRKLDDMSVDQLNVRRSLVQFQQVFITAAMTVMEERYHAYMNALREILKARGKGVPSDDPDSGSTTDVKVNNKK